MIHHDQTIEQRQIAGLTARARLVPELQCAAPSRLPVKAQVIDHGQLALEVTRAIAIEVGVQGEVPAGQGQRWPRSAEMGVGDQPLDSGQRRQKIQKCHAR